MSASRAQYRARLSIPVTRGKPIGLAVGRTHWKVSAVPVEESIEEGQVMPHDSEVAIEKGMAVKQEDALLGARGDDHLLRPGPLVQQGDRPAKLGAARRLGVPAPAFQQPLVGVWLELEQFRYRPRLTVAAREHEPGAVFVLSVEALNPERAQFHDN